VFSYTEIRQIAKDVSEAAKKSKNAELLDQVLDLKAVLLDLMDQNQNLKDEIRDLRDQVANLSNIQIQRDSVVKFHDMFVDKDKLKTIKGAFRPYRDELLEHMYCSKCLQDKDKKISMNLFRQSVSNNYTLVCPSCGSKVIFDHRY